MASSVLRSSSPAARTSSSAFELAIATGTLVECLTSPGHLLCHGERLDLGPFGPGKLGLSQGDLRLGYLEQLQRSLVRRRRVAPLDVELNEALGQLSLGNLCRSARSDGVVEAPSELRGRRAGADSHLTVGLRFGHRRTCEARR